MDRGRQAHSFENDACSGAQLEDAVFHVHGRCLLRLIESTARGRGAGAWEPRRGPGFVDGRPGPGTGVARRQPPRPSMRRSPKPAHKLHPRLDGWGCAPPTHPAY